MRTLVEKIVGRAAGRAVARGEVVTCRVDLAMMHDSGGPRRVAPILERLGVGPWDPARVVVVSDHYVPAVDAESAGILDLTRRWAREQGIERFHDMRGICHVVVQEAGYLRPGLFVVGGDSHSPTGGAAGCFMFGVGATDMAGVLATGETWIRVPGTVLLRWQGTLGPGVSAKDMALAQCARFPDGVDYEVVEYAGEAVGALSHPERMTLCNMAAELGAQTGIVAPDETTARFIREAGADPGDYAAWHGDEDADYLAVHELDAATLEPQVATPHAPDNAAPVADTLAAAAAPDGSPVRDVHIDQAYIGACTGAKLEDLQMAARVLRGRRVDDRVRLLVAAASTRATAVAAADGTLAALTEAGAIVMPSGCGACAGYGAGVLADGETCIASTARNYQGRMGSRHADVYLASPYTVAASAIAGRIADPREYL